MSQRGNLFSTLNLLADQIGASKVAAANAAGHIKVAGPTPADPGGYAGGSSHPITKIDNGAQASSEGSRASENSSDVKAMIGKGSIDSAPESGVMAPGSQTQAQIDGGLKKTPTGEDPATEDAYKGKKDDPGTTHPANMSTNEKYARMTFHELRAQHVELANALCADLITNNGQATKAANTQQVQAPAVNDQGLSATIEKAAAALQNTPAPDVLAGYELAAYCGIDKTAAFQAVADTLEASICEALADADRVGQHIIARRKQASSKKKAGDGDASGEDHSKPGDADTGASASAGTNGDTDDSSSGGSGGPPGGGGSSPSDALLGGLGDATGGPPGGGGQPSLEELLTQLVAALQEMGVGSQELAGGGGDAPPGMGGGDPMAPMGGGSPPPGGEMLPPDTGMKLAHAVRQFQRSGKFRFKEAADGSRERWLREEMKGLVQRVLNHK